MRSTVPVILRGWTQYGTVDLWIRNVRSLDNSREIRKEYNKRCPAVSRLAAQAVVFFACCCWLLFCFIFYIKINILVVFSMVIIIISSSNSSILFLLRSLRRYWVKTEEYILSLLSEDKATSTHTLVRLRVKASHGKDCIFYLYPKIPNTAESFLQSI